MRSPSDGDTIIALARDLKYLAIAFLAVAATGGLRSSRGLPHFASEECKEIPSEVHSSQVQPSSIPTYYRDVQSILRQHCVVCHRTEGLAPMSFETYEAARSYAYLIRNVAQERTMPPAFAVPLAGRVSNDPSLTPTQISTLADWTDSNAMAGDAKDAPPLPAASAPWSIPKPDQVVKMREPVSVPASGNLEYVYEIVATNFTKGRWIQMAEVLPSLPANVRQIIVVIRRPGSRWLQHAPVGKSFTSGDPAGGEEHSWPDEDTLLVYSPGSLTQNFPASMGKYIPAGSDLVFRIQFAANGLAGSEQSSVGLVFCKTKPSSRVITLALENERFKIPPNALDYRVEARGVLRKDVLLLGFFPLLHLRGKQFEYDVVHTPGETNPEIEALLRVNFTLRWQPSYQLSEPRFLKAGTELRAVAWYDNSSNNPNNPDPDASVNVGDRPKDEVLGGYFEVAVPANMGQRGILSRHP